MKVLKNAGRFEILNEGMLREFLKLIERAGRTCYQSEKGEIDQESSAGFISRRMKQKPFPHLSILDHGWMIVKFFNCSRGFTHELVRHRLAGYSQESTRYVDYAKEGDESVDLSGFQVNFVVPPHRDENQPIALDDGRIMTPVQMAGEEELFYRGLRKAGWPPEDARQWLPNGIKADIVMSADFAEWRHVFSMRTQKAAHWEIRKVMGDLLVYVQKVVPVVFDDFVEAGFDKNGLRYFEQKPL